MKASISKENSCVKLEKSINENCTPQKKEWLLEAET